jgi:hypothetical protein
MKRMRLCSLRPKTTRLARVIVCALVALCVERSGHAQDIPLISGGVAFFTNTNAGKTNYQPYIEPVIAAPLGSHLLVESRATVLDTFSPKASGGYQRDSLFKTMDYLQADVLLGPHLTLVAGQFLTPFGTYNERLTQIWVANFQDTPLNYSIGSMNTGDGVGGMLRGSVVSTQDYSISYAAYYSANVNSNYFGAERSSGGQTAIYLPKQGLELGASYGRSLAGTHENNVGIHVWWQPINSPFRFRSEYAHATHDEGYWFETDYRLSHFGGNDSAVGRLEPIFRMQQTFRSAPDSTNFLPTNNQQEPEFGVNYYLPHEVRINSSYERQLGNGNANIWETGIIYRFLFPIWKGKAH